ncbi:hypothetical protein MTX11_16425 [Acinetobacter lwoffii]|uniref:hypothetical protein n=1 Tax=Acinetobacter lwoffii TaxID=28090 RepID=UPI001FB2839E|nr:hypothetical protein [Acinetobacter lwoffii]MCJ0929514.1 hypothetical protein [Acinetobacter lwoffii]
MKYSKLKKFVKQTNNRNVDLSVSDLKGINMNKNFFPSVANINGTDMSKYKIVFQGQFAFNPMHVGRDKLVPISLHLEENPIIVSPAYITFEICNDEILPQYLMYWFQFSDFDRKAWFTTDNSVRGGLSWDSFIDMDIPVPSKEMQAIICLRDILPHQDKVNLRKTFLNFKNS